LRCAATCGVAAAADREQCEVKGIVCGAGRPARAQPDAPPQRNEGGPFHGERDSPRDIAPSGSNPSYFGAIAFTADGSRGTVWKMTSRAEAEANVAKRCAKFGRGSCEVVAFPGEQCVGLATFIGRSGRTRWKLSFTGGGATGPDAQRTAMDRCNGDNRTRRNVSCEPWCAATGADRTLTHRARSCEQQSMRNDRHAA
jgi:hypothetical protein